MADGSGTIAGALEMAQLQHPVVERFGLLAGERIGGLRQCRCRRQHRECQHVHLWQQLHFVQCRDGGIVAMQQELRLCDVRR